MTMNTLPIVLVDMDAISDMSPWADLAESRQWDEFFSHIPDAKPHDNAVLDLVELAQADGCRVMYTCRWDSAYRPQTWEWLERSGFPPGVLYMRPSNRPSPDWLQVIHARAASERAKFRRPVLIISGDADLAADVRRAGVTAVGVFELPETVGGFRELLAHARVITESEN